MAKKFDASTAVDEWIESTRLDVTMKKNVVIHVPSPFEWPADTPDEADDSQGFMRAVLGDQTEKFIKAGGNDLMFRRILQEAHKAAAGE